MSKWISEQMISESPVQAVLVRRKRDLGGRDKTG